MEPPLAATGISSSKAPAQRSARLVLVAPDGGLVGELPPVNVSTPWWQDAAPVVEAAQERFGISVTILRLLEAELERPPGGEVTYLAEVAGQVEAGTSSRKLHEHPLRQSYARPGGPGADIAWAESQLKKIGMVPAGAPIQVRTWNLSSLWRIPLPTQTAWLKVVPPFFAHEGQILAHLADQNVPKLLGHDGARILLSEIPGQDLYDAELPELLEMVATLVGIQSSSDCSAEALLAIGLPDWRADALCAAVEGVLERNWEQLPDEERASLKRFVAGLAQRFAELAACGLDDGLIHGDFHPGNFRGDGHCLTLLDWGDSGVGHPLLDQAAFLDRTPRGSVDAVREHWSRCWLASVPGSDPVRASMLIAPIATARQAVVYQRFLDHIEPAEFPYHAADPAEWLHRTAVCAQAELRVGKLVDGHSDLSPMK